MRATVKKWGNSAAVRIPASVMQATRLDLDEVVDVREGITSNNQHDAVDFGPAVGKEVW
jgi:antitoxin MazE